MSHEHFHFCVNLIIAERLSATLY